MSKECYYQLAYDLKICRIANGMWQVAGGHGYIDHELAIEDMMRYHETGFTTWDLADIYGPAEDFIGEYRHKLSRLKGKQELDNIQALTKWVPQPRTITRSIVNENIEKSLRRMSVNSLDLLQFHWWDYNNPYYMDALKYLSDLRDKGRQTIPREIKRRRSKHRLGPQSINQPNSSAKNIKDDDNSRR
jgi:aryl-alcohol dehydrogenase-like predicted oxidoreductase